MKKVLLSLMLVCFAFLGVARADEMTVHDGTTTNSYVPVYGFYADAYLKCEMVYPADELLEMAGGTIYSMTFYASQANVDWGTEYQVFVSEVSDATISAFAGPGTVIYEGALSIVGGQMVVNFATPYAYGGNNLLVGVYQTNQGDYITSSWYGETMTGASVTGYSYNGLDGITASQRDFLPKTTFGFTPGEVSCAKPETLEVSNITSNAATFTWTSEVGNYTFEYKKASDEEWTVVSGLTATTYTLNTLMPLTTYNVRVKAVCGTDSESFYNTLSFSTLAGIPLVETFGTAIPTGWAQYTGLLSSVMAGETQLATASYGWIVGAGSNGVFDNHAYANIYGTSCQRWLVLPTLTMENNVELTFEVAYTAYSGTGAPAQTGTDDKFVVLIQTAAGWEILRQWDNAGSSYVLNDLDPTPIAVNINLSSYAGQAIAVAFYAESTESNADNNIHIDNVSLDYIPACPKPTGLTVNYTGGTTATVSWTSDATNFNLDVNGTVINNVTNPYNLTGLDLATVYTVMVQSSCGADGTSEWTAPVNFTTDLCMQEDQCVIYFVTIDSYGDGWNGAYIEVVDVETGITIGAVTNENQDGTTGEEYNYWSLSVCKDREIQFVWHAGSYDSECYFGVFDVNENEIFEDGAMTEPYNHTVDCTITDCRKPSTPEAIKVGPHSAELSWTEYGPATEWTVAYKSAADDEFTEVTATENPFTLTNLVPLTTYVVTVTPVCDVEFTSEECTFSTTEPCPKPTDLVANHVTAETATLNWEGWGSEYNVRYGVMAHGQVLESIDFEDSDYGSWTSIDADGDGYDWVLGSLAGGIYLVDGGSLAGSGYEESADLLVSGSYSNVSGVGALTPDNYFVSPQVELGGTISFWACAQDAGYPAEKFGVAVSTTSNTDADAFTTIWTKTLTAKSNGDGVRGDAAMFVKRGAKANPGTTRSGNRDQGTWYHYTVDLSSYSGQGYVAIRHFDCTDQFMLDVDNIVIEGPAQIIWNDLNTSETSIDIDGLEAETEYIWQVQADCLEDGASPWSDLMSFTTTDYCTAPSDLEALNITSNGATLTWYGSQEDYELKYRTAEIREEVYFNNFNAGSTTLQNEGWSWTGYIIYGVDDPIYGIDGDENYFLQMGWATTEEAFIYSPELPAYPSGSVVEFYPFYYNAENTFQIGYSTTTNDADAFSWSEPITAGTSDYDLKYSDVLPDGVKYIAFKATAEDQNHCIFIDNFGIYNIVAPASDWYEEEVRGESTFDLDGFDPNTTIEWMVRGANDDCEGGSEDGYTEWSKMNTFTTLDIQAQTIDLVAGWNWVSFSKVITLADLKAALLAANPGARTTIKSKGDGQVMNTTGTNWTGALNALDLSQMYEIKVANACTIELKAETINPADYPATIHSGANWIAYPLEVEMTVKNAFSGFAARTDQVKSKTDGVATFITPTNCNGALTTLKPGNGYIYISKATEDKPFTYPNPSK